MALFEGKTPAERNKMIAAIVLPVFVFILLVRMFSGPSGPSAASTNNNNRRQSAPKTAQNSNARNANAPLADDAEIEVTNYSPIVCCAPLYGGADAGRNIFAFYEKPVALPKPSETSIPIPTPTPPPPIPLASISPQSVFAKTGNFTLQLSGDKFGPDDRVYVDGQELQTQYRSIQQLTATVPAGLIGGPGQRSVVVRTPDGKLFSNPQLLNVMQPPAPTYTYVGFLKRARANTAVLKDSRGELYSVREGDLVEGRFRVTEISDRGVEVVDKDLNIKHTMPYVASGTGNNSGMGPASAPGAIRPPPPPNDDGGDEEPQN
jgi:hypothetical protein